MPDENSLPDKKYEFTDEIRTSFPTATVLHRIRALRDFSDVKKGDIGGFIEKEENLSHEGDCWIYGDCWVLGDTQVSGNGMVSGFVMVFSGVKILDNARVSGHIVLYRDVEVSGAAQLSGHMVLSGVKISGSMHITGDFVGSLLRTNCAQIYSNKRAG
jgi:cytoskeletal protein CcmA (bactofilin family)